MALTEYRLSVAYRDPRAGGVWSKNLIGTREQVLARAEREHARMAKGGIDYVMLETVPDHRVIKIWRRGEE